jgi:hypothetical protein
MRLRDAFLSEMHGDSTRPGKRAQELTSDLISTIQGAPSVLRKIPQPSQPEKIHASIPIPASLAITI